MNPMMELTVSDRLTANYKGPINSQLLSMNYIYKRS